MKIPEGGDEKIRKKAIDYGEKLMEQLDFSYSEISTYFMEIESVKALDNAYCCTRLYRSRL